MFTQAILVGIGGFLGAICRFLVSKHTTEVLGIFPIGTLIVNVSGSFLLGFIMYSALAGRMVSPELRSLVAVGFIGAFTTMSTFAYETARFADLKDYMLAGLNITLNVGLCLLAVYLGKQAVLLTQLAARR
jgi:CrcB protein